MWLEQDFVYSFRFFFSDIGGSIVCGYSLEFCLSFLRVVQLRLMLGEQLLLLLLMLVSIQLSLVSIR